MHSIREIKCKSITEISKEANDLLNNAIFDFDKQIGFNNYNMIIYPDISHNQLVRYLVNLIKLRINYMKTNTIMYEMPKNDPSMIIINDYAKLKRSCEEIGKYLEEVHKLDYFSIAKNGGHFRKYVREFIDVNTQELLKGIREATSKIKILLFDDVNTTGSTLREIIRKLHGYNNALKFEIYTIIGKG